MTNQLKDRVWSIKKRNDINDTPVEVDLFNGTESECIARCYELFKELYGVEANNTFGNVVSRQGNDVSETRLIQYIDIANEAGGLTILHAKV